MTSGSLRLKNPNLVWVMASSFSAILESANDSPIVAGLNATARPSMELALRKQRRDLSSGSFIVCSFALAGVVAQYPDGTSAYAMPVRFPSAISSVFRLDPSRLAL
jgi:hypothetical protein